HEILNPLQIPLGIGITGYVALSGKPEIINDVTEDHRYVPDVTPGGSEICVPIIHDKELLGVIDCESPEKNHFDQNDLEILETVASYASAKIAERRAHDSAVARAKELEDKVKQLTALKEELEVAKEKAEEHSALKSKFVAAISHEIRTPLSGILGSLDLLHDEKLPQRSSALVDMARSSGQTLQTLLNDVIDFARSEAGTLQLEPVAFSITELINSIQAFWQPHLQAKSCALGVDISAEIGDTYWGDPARIRQIMNNYISNALKYSGSETLILSVYAQHLEPNSETHQLIFSLQDFGEGLSDEDQTKVFEEFSQTGNHRRQIGDGAGLGLAICSQLADLMKGEVGVTSQLGTGATFWLKAGFKLAQPEESKVNVPAANLVNFKDRIGRRARVLVAEDVPTNQIIIRMELERIGCRVTIVNNGVEAVEAARNYTYDIIFMDIAMPEMDGVTATKRIIEIIGEDDAPPIYALTAHGMDEDKQEFQAAGMQDIVTKPFEREDLYLAIEKSLELIEDNAAHAPADAALNLDEVPFFDQDKLFSLLGNLDDDSCTLLLGQSVKDLQKCQDAIMRGLDESAPNYVSQMAHQLKSVSGTFGLTRIQHISQHANESWKQGMVDETLAAGRVITDTLPEGIAMIENIAKSYKAKELSSDEI
ncbi:MAG: response regulator, partial [Kordiimonas sp.]